MKVVTYNIPVPVMENRDSGVADVEIDHQQCMDHVHVHGYVYYYFLIFRICTNLIEWKMEERFIYFLNFERFLFLENGQSG